MARLLIFDFDGTLARSKSLYLNAIYSSLKKSKYRISKYSIKKVLGPRLETLLPGLGINDAKKIKFLIGEVNKIAIKKSPALTACPSISSLRKILNENRCVLVTNSLTSYALPFLKKHNLNFLEVLGSDKFSSKQQAFRMLFRKFKVKPSESIYIADRAEDVDVARDAGCKSAIISNKCSWSSLSEIKKKKPDCILRDLIEARDLI